MGRARIASLVATTVLGLTAPLSGQVAPPSPDPAPPARPAAAERFNLGLRGVYFVENQGQWSDASVHYGLKSRGLDVAFRDSSFTMHLSRERSEPGCATPTSRPSAMSSGSNDAREEAGLGEEGEHPSIDLHDAYSLVSDYDGQFADHRVPLSRGRRAPLPPGGGSSGNLLHHEIRGVEDSAPAYEHLTLTVSFPGSNAVTPRGAQPQTAKFNYFVGGEGRGTASNVPSFAAVIYEDLYDGIDLHVTGNDDGVMKYEFHCAPGADYSQIRIHYDGIDSLCVNAEGDLEIATTFGTLRDGAPIVWQEEAAGSEYGGTAVPAVQLESGGTAVPAVDTGSMGVLPVGQSAAAENGRDARSTNPFNGRDARSTGRPTLPARFELVDAHTYRIALDAAPDPSLPLVIDPEVEWMMYLGGTDDDRPFGISTDAEGNSFVCGWTLSGDFEGRQNAPYGFMDAFVSKVTSSGTLLWMTYCGGSAQDRANAVIMDTTGVLLLTGYSASRDLTGRTNEHHGGTRDAFVARLDSSGVVLSSIYLGGTGDDWGWDIALDRMGSAYVSGYTDSIDFEGRANEFHGGPSDAFLLKFGARGSLQWMMYLGGSGRDAGRGDLDFYWYVRLAVDSTGHAYISGSTSSLDFEGRLNGNHGFPRGPDAYVLRVSPAGQLLWMLYLGGSNTTNAGDVACDDRDNVVTVGWTRANDFEGRLNESPGGENNGYAVRVSQVGKLRGMWYYGARRDDTCDSVVIDSDGDVIMTGWTTSDDWPSRTNSLHGSYDAFVLKVDRTGHVLSFTYLGGLSQDGGDGIATDITGSAFIVGETRSADFEGRTNAYHGGMTDASIVKVSFSTPLLSVSSDCPQGGPARISWSDATPDGRIVLAFARSPGQFVIPEGRPCEGTVLGLGLDHRQVAFVGSSGGHGSRTLNTNAGPGACGGYLQLLDLTTCGTSNVARVE